MENKTKSKITKTLINIFKYICVVIIAAIVGYFLLVAVYKFSNFYAINKNVYDSEVIFEREGDYPSNFTSDTVLDNSTDRIMINISEYDGRENPFGAAASAPRIVAEDACQYHNWRKYEAERDHEQMCLQEVSYTRYWHGYQTILRPLFTFFTFQEIRDVMSFIYVGLLIVISVFLVKKKLSLYIAPLVTSIIAMNFTSLTMSLQYSTTTITTLIAILVMLSVTMFKKDIKVNSNFYRYLFLITGCVINYMDLLTFPIFSVGMLSIFYLIINKEDPLKTKFINLCINILLWGLGYGLMWIMKWVIASIVLQQNAFTSAFNAASIRLQTGDETVKYTIVETVLKQFKAVSKFSYLVNLICIVVNLGLSVFVFKKRKISIKNIMLYIMTALMPVVWYVVLRNHSFIHVSMTFRGTSVLFMSLNCIAVDIFVKKDKVTN